MVALTPGHTAKFAASFLWAELMHTCSPQTASWWCILFLKHPSQLTQFGGEAATHSIPCSNFAPKHMQAVTGRSMLPSSAMGTPLTSRIRIHLKQIGKLPGFVEPCAWRSRTTCRVHFERGSNIGTTWGWPRHRESLLLNHYLLM